MHTQQICPKCNFMWKMNSICAVPHNSPLSDTIRINQPSITSHHRWAGYWGTHTLFIHSFTQQLRNEVISWLWVKCLFILSPFSSEPPPTEEGNITSFYITVTLVMLLHAAYECFISSQSLTGQPLRRAPRGRWGHGEFLYTAHLSKRCYRKDHETKNKHMQHCKEFTTS